MPDTIALVGDAPSFDVGQLQLARFARLAAAAATIEAELASEIAPLKAAADAQLAPIAAEMDEIRGLMPAWWAAHAAELTKGKRKSAELAGCVLGTRVGKAKLVLPEGGEERAIELLRAGSHTSLYSKVVAYTLDKPAIVAKVDAEPDGAIAALGFGVVRPETFFLDLAVRTGRKG